MLSRRSAAYTLSLHISDIVNVPMPGGTVAVRCYALLHKTNHHKQRTAPQLPPVALHHFHAKLDHHALLECTLVFKDDVLAKEKYLVVVVLYHLEAAQSTRELGCVRVPLSLLIEQDDLRPQKYLLQDLKVNLILTMAAALVPLDGTSHTPRFLPLADEGLLVSGTGVSGTVGASRTTNGGSKGAPIGQDERPLILDPVINRFFVRFCDITWDTQDEEFTPLECVDDIFRGGSGWALNEEGVPLVDVRTAADAPVADGLDIGEAAEREISEMVRHAETHADNGTCGLVREAHVRDNLQSWVVPSAERAPG